MGGAEPGDVGDMGRAGLGMQGELARWAAAVGGGSPRSAETSLNNCYSPVCVRPMERPSHACPRHARACIVLPRAAPQTERPREPREPDTAEDAGGQTDHLGQAL